MSTESKGLFSFFASSGAKGGYPCSIKIHCLFIVTHTLTTTVVCQSIEWARAKGRHGIWYYQQSKSQYSSGYVLGGRPRAKAPPNGDIERKQKHCTTRLLQRGK